MSIDKLPELVASFDNEGAHVTVTQYMIIDKINEVIEVVNILMAAHPKQFEQSAIAAAVRKAATTGQPLPGAISAIPDTHEVRDGGIYPKRP